MGGRKHKPLDFDIPTLVWTDDKGNEVRHPECPDVDDTYQFRLKHLVKFLSTIMFGNNIWLHGHTGTGKTTFAEQVAARLQFIVMRLNMDANMDSSDVKGSKDLDVKDGAPITVFTEGILPQAMVRPCWFVLDECDAGRADVLFVIQRALESKGLIITEDGGRLVKPHEHFRFIATANSRGQGDEHGWYQGVRPMNLAFLDRFGAFIEIGYLDKDDEVRMLQTAYPALADTEAKEMCQFSQEIRKAFMGGEISTTLSPRGLHAMAQYYLHFKSVLGDTQSGRRAATKDAVETVVIDKAPSDCSQTIQQLASTSFGGW
jgi:cobaltochelatase CobS